MRQRTVRMLQELPVWFQVCTLEELYVLAQAFSNELARRGLDARLEARSLECALLDPARREHRAIFSADCSERELATTKYEHVEGCVCVACERLAEES